MKDLLRRIITATVLGTVALAASAAAELEPTPEPVSMKDGQPDISRNVSKLIEELHYSQPDLDNSLSSAILDLYLDTLDGNRMYFLSSDIASFGKYRYELDERAKSGRLEPVFEIFNTFRERARERFTYALELLEEKPDFTVDEDYRFDRSDLGWPVSEEEMRDTWRRKVKSDALSLVLADEPWPDIVETLTERYERSYKRIAQLTADDVFESFMNSVAHTMDPHSSYLSPRQSEEYRIQMSLSYEGIGASLKLEDDYVVITEIIPGGPAQADGRLKPEDRITAVGQEGEELVDVIGWRLEEVVEIIRGPGGTEVRLQILPAGAAPGSEQNVITLTRDEVKLEERAAKKEIVDVDLGGESYKVGVIEVPSFYQDFQARSRGDEDYTSTSRDVERLLGELKAENVAAVVMDLRRNGGGHLSEATRLSGLFIDRGPLVQLRETRGDTQVLDDPDPDTVYDGPLAVLVDRYSASASEIFAAAIQDYERGVIIGQRTFGKGSVQNLFNLDRVMRGEDNGQLTLTIGKYYRVTGDSTQNRGVMPDIELPPLVPTDTVGESTRDTALPWDQIQPTGYNAEASLDAAIAALNSDNTSWAADNPDYSYLVENIENMKEQRARDSVSLNAAEREAKREREDAEQLELENERRRALGLEPFSSLEELESADGHSPERIQLELATRVVADLVRSNTPGPQSRASARTGAR